MAKRLAAQLAFWLVTPTLSPVLLTFAVLRRNTKFFVLSWMCALFQDVSYQNVKNVLKRKTVSFRLDKAQKVSPRLGPLRDVPAVGWAVGRPQWRHRGAGELLTALSLVACLGGAQCTNGGPFISLSSVSSLLTVILHFSSQFLSSSLTKESFLFNICKFHSLEPLYRLNS